MYNFKTNFHTKILPYICRRYFETLPFRPQIGDKVPFHGQDQFPKLPVLIIIGISYEYDEYGFTQFNCELGFGKDVDPAIVSLS